MGQSETALGGGFAIRIVQPLHVANTERVEQVFLRLFIEPPTGDLAEDSRKQNCGPRAVVEDTARRADEGLFEYVATQIGRDGPAA